MKCKEIQEKGFNYFDGSIDLEEKAVIKNHIINCDECRHAFHILEQSNSVIETEKQLKPNPYLFTHISQKIENQKISVFKLIPSKLIRYALVTYSIFTLIFSFYFFTEKTQLNPTNHLSINESYYEEYVDEVLLSSTDYLLVDFENE